MLKGIFLAGVIGLGMAVAPSMAEEARHEGMVLVFEEEFDRSEIHGEGILPYRHAFPAGNRKLVRELQIYTDPDHLDEVGLPAELSPFSIDDGVLSITARPLEPDQAEKLGGGYASGLFTTFGSFTFQYGYVEIRAKLPTGAGLWPALWLYAEDNKSQPYREIDIIEMLGHRPKTAYFTVHAGENHPDRRILQARVPFEVPLADDFHVYSVEWTPETITFRVDDREMMRVGTPPEVNSHLYLLANLAVGGPWGGVPDETTPFPARLEIDSIRIWQRPGWRHKLRGVEVVAGE